MMNSPRFEITTPAGKTVPLWVTQKAGRDIINEVDKTSIPYREPEENIRSNMGQEEELALQGVATHDIFRQSDEYSDGEQGMAEWAQDVFALGGAQGQSLTMTDRLVSRDFDLYIKDFNFDMVWPRNQRIEWDMSLVRGRGLTPYNDKEPKTANPGQVATLDGITLDSPQSFSMRKSVDVDVNTLPDLSGDSGAERNFITETGTDRQFNFTFKSYRDIEDQLRNLREFTANYEFQTPFPGAVYQVSVDDVSVNRGTDAPIEYEVTMTQ